MNKKRNSVIFFLIWVCFLLFPQICSGGSGKLKVSLITIAGAGEYFWGKTISMAQAAADDLDIDFEVLYANRNHIKAIELAREVCGRREKPDYLIVVSEKKIGGKSLALAEKAGIDVMLFGSLTEKEEQRFGRPRQRLSHWIGSRAVNEFALGRETAAALVNRGFEQRLTDGEGFLNIIALAGENATSYSDGRVRGLLDALQDDRKTRLLQVVPTDWTEADGYRVTMGLYHRYEKRFGRKIGAIWAANSQLALGAIRAGKEMGFTAGEDFVISAIEWEEKAFDSVADGELLTVNGGHFSELAWMLVMLYDYHHGVDFMEDVGEVSGGLSLTRKNLAVYQQLFASGDWQQVDFTRFSKVLSPGAQCCSLTFSEIMAQFVQEPKQSD